MPSAWSNLGLEPTVAAAGTQEGCHSAGGETGPPH